MDTGKNGFTAPDGADIKTFTQDEVNRSVSERLTKERTKFDGQFAERERELDKREFRLYALETLRQNGLPDELFGLISSDDRETFEQSALILREIIGGGLDKNASSDSGNAVGGMSFSSTRPVNSGGDDIRRAMGIR